MKLKSIEGRVDTQGGGDLVARDKRRLKNQRRELRRLNVALKNAKAGKYTESVRGNLDALRGATAAMRHVTGDEAWNAGMRHGMRMARDMMAPHVSADLIARLSHEIAWRFEGATKDEATLRSRGTSRRKIAVQRVAAS